MKAYLALAASAVLLFSMNTAQAGCDEHLADKDLNIAGGMTDDQIHQLLAKAEADATAAQQAASATTEKPSVDQKVEVAASRD